MKLNNNLIALSLPFILISISFGIFLTKIGIYGDSWVVTYGMSLGYDEAKELLSSEKPFCTWLWYSYYKIAEFNPLIWNLMFFIIRLLLSAIIYFLIKDVFKNSIIAVVFSILYSLYPGFTQYGLTQIYLINFTLITFIYSSYFLTIQYLLHGNKILLLSSLILSIISYFSMDYYLGMELARYIFIFLYFKFNPEIYSLRKNEIKKLVIYFISPVILFLSWRMFFFKTSRAISDQSGIIKKIFTDPTSEILKRIEFFFTDIFESLVLSWNQSVNAEMFNFDNRSNYLSIILLIILPIICFYFLKNLNKKLQVNSDIFKIDIKVILICGISYFIIGLCPIWFANREINLINYQAIGNVATTDRYILPGLFGVILIDIGLLIFFTRDFKRFIIISSILIAISTNFQFRNSLIYKTYNTEHIDFLSQLKLRIPNLMPNTTVFVFGKNNIFPKNSNAIGLSINVLYDSTYNKNLKYYCYNLSSKLERYNISKLSDSIIMDTCLSLIFKGEKNRVLLVNYNSEESLRIIDSTSINFITDLDPVARRYSSVSNISVIKNYSNFVNFDKIISNSQNKWNYLYQSASLRKQFGDNHTVFQIGKYILKNKIKPYNGSEVFIFIEEFVRRGYIKDAIEFYNISKSDINNTAEIQEIAKKYSFLL